MMRYRNAVTATTTTAVIGAAVFLIGTILHPARDGHGVAAAGHTYGVTHAVQAIGLALQAIALANLTAPAGRRLIARNAALAGVVAWLGLIVYDGAVNPATARYAPQLVHTAANLDAGGALIVLPALVLFPIGFALLAATVIRDGDRWTGLLLGAGAVTYWIGGLLIFAAGPHSPFIQVLEIAGAVPYAVGFARYGGARQGGARDRGTPLSDRSLRPTT
jgi:hypothetical protein